MGATTNWNTAGIGNYPEVIYLPPPSGSDDTAIISSILEAAPSGTNIEWHPFRTIS